MCTHCFQNSSCDEYLFAIREIERRIETAENDNSSFVPTIERPSGVPIGYNDYAKLMFDLQILAIQADWTRVITFMLGREASLRAYPEFGVMEPRVQNPIHSPPLDAHRSFQL